MNQLRILSYLPNPRLWKATIAARLNGVQVEISGWSPRELANWRWDYDARALSPAELADSADVRTGATGLETGQPTLER
jgi:elongation factor 1-gamma